jgi:hypothetical protein
MTVESDNNVADSGNSTTNFMDDANQARSSSLSSQTSIHVRLQKLLLSGSVCGGVCDDEEGNDTIGNVAPNHQAVHSDSNNSFNKSSTLDTGIGWLDSLELECVTDNDEVNTSSSSPTSVTETDTMNHLRSPDESEKTVINTNDDEIKAAVNNTTNETISDNDASCLSLCASNSSRGIPRSVSFADSVVTHVRETPRYRPEDVSKMFYSRQDIQRLALLEFFVVHLIML